jgi:hypothetical protein
MGRCGKLKRLCKKVPNDWNLFAREKYYFNTFVEWLDKIIKLKAIILWCPLSSGILTR